MKKMQTFLGINPDGSVIEEVLQFEYNLEAFYKHMIIVLSKYMSHYFTLAPGDSEYVCSIPIDKDVTELGGHNVNKLRINMNVFKTTIALTEDMTKSFTVFYGCYNMPQYKSGRSNVNPHFKKDGYKIIINIVPTESRLSRLGLNNKFILSGILIYKMFDYATATTALQLERSHNTILYNGKYKFAGDLLTKMWPLNLVTESDAHKAESVWESNLTPRNTLPLPPPAPPLSRTSQHEPLFQYENSMMPSVTPEVSRAANAKGGKTKKSKKTTKLSSKKYTYKH
jgi:hypothetical protein